MNATILAAGDNGQYGGFFSAGLEYLAAQLDAMGINAHGGAILNNDVARSMDQLHAAIANDDLVIILTAPQPDTATLVAALLAKGLGLELAVSPQAQACVQAHAAQLGTPLSRADEQAFCTLPTGAITLKNTTGFLQGYVITARRQLLLVLPAAPSELQASFAGYVGELVGRFAASQQPQTVAAGAAQPTAIAPPPVRSTPEPAPKTEADTVVAVCRALEQAGLSIATAESGTSGALAQTLGSCRSSCFAPNAAFFGKESLEQLQVDPGLLQSFGPVSPEAATALALAARSNAATSLGVAITSGKPHAQSEPVAYLAVTDGQQVWSRSFAGSANSPHQLRLGAVLEALGLLNLYANGNPPTGIAVPEALGGRKARPVASTGLMGRFGGLQKARPTPPKGSDGNDMPRTNLLQRMRRGMLTKNDFIRLGAVAVFLCVFIGSMVYIGSVYKESDDNLKLTDDLKGLLASGGTNNDKPKDGYPKDYQARFSALYAQNADIMGWIKIDGTQVDYPVLQSTDNLYYERRDFTRKDNQHGVPFLDFRVDAKAPSTNSVIYAHNMNDGQMFGELMNYKSLSYYKEHPIVQYDSVYGDGDYKIFGVVLCKKNDPDFNYHNFIDMDEKEMTDYVTKIRERSLINTGVDVRTDDTLITLSTCDYTFKSNDGDRIARFVVFARKLRPGESATIEAGKASLNLNPVMPKEWSDTLAKQQEAERKKQAEQQAAAVNKAWLTEDELTSLSSEEQKQLAAGREEDAAKYLLSEEKSLDLREKLSIIDSRRENFRYFLASDEQSLSLSKRISLADERESLARQWLSWEEISAAGKWSRIDALIAERQQGNPDEQKWLTAEELKTLSASKKQSTIADRKAQAKAAGLSDDEIASANSWSDIQQMIAAKQMTPEKYIKQYPLWLDSRDAGLTVDELSSVMASRKQSAKNAGVDSGKYTKWADLEAAITKAEQNAGTAKYITDNKAWLNTAETTGLSLTQLKELVAARQTEAKNAGLDVATLSSGQKSWTETKAAIDKKLAENAQASEAERQKVISQNAAYLNESDKALPLADLNKLIADRKGQVGNQLTAAELASSTSWTHTQELIAAKKPPNPSTSNPTPPVDPSTSNPTPPVDPSTPSSTPDPSTPSSVPEPSSTTPEPTPPPTTPEVTPPPPEATPPPPPPAA